MQDVEALLTAVKNGTLSVADAALQLKAAPFLDLGFAKLDLHRKLRTGMAEVVFCQGKDDRFLTEIFRRLYAANGEVLGTRCSPSQAELLKQTFPELDYDSLSGTVLLQSVERKAREGVGCIAIVTAGTADLKVAEEAARTCEFFGSRTVKIYDAGVSGLHRLLSRLTDIQSANVIIAVAGMEGALASVIGGLVSVPVIAVPTSAGYGANFKGLAALLTMLNSCSNGVSTVNIDNGYGAAYIAVQINRLAVKGRMN